MRVTSVLKEIREVFDRILIHAGQQPDYHLGVGFGRHDGKEGKEITKELGCTQVYSSQKFGGVSSSVKIHLQQI